MIDLDTPNPITARLIQAFAEMYFPTYGVNAQADARQASGHGSPRAEKVVWSSGPESCKHEYQAGDQRRPLHPFPAAPPQPDAIPQSGVGGNPNQGSK